MRNNGGSPYDWDALFERYVEMGATRSIQQFSKDVGVPRETITRAAKRHDWATRLERIEAGARERADRRLVKDRAARVQDSLRVIDLAREKFEGQVKRSEVRLTGSDFVGLVKLEQLLEGEATERIDGDVRVLVEAVLGIVRVFVEDTTGSVDERRGRMLELVRGLPLGVPAGEPEQAAA